MAFVLIDPEFCSKAFTPIFTYTYLAFFLEGPMRQRHRIAIMTIEVSHVYFKSLFDVGTRFGKIINQRDAFGTVLWSHTWHSVYF